MKNGGRIICVISAALAIFTAAGCSHVTPDVIPIIKETLCCRPVANQLTRSDVNTDPWLKGMTFKGWAFTLPEGEKWTDSSRSSAQCIADGETFSAEGTDSLWYSTSRNMWTSAETVSLFAISPVEGNYVFSRENGVYVKDYDILSGIDLRYASPSLNNSMSAHTFFVPLVFKHARCKVDLRVNTVGSQYDIIVKRITLINAQRYGSFSVNKETWTNNAKELINRDFPLGKEELPIKSQKIISLEDKPLWFLPQSLTSSCFEIEYLLDFGNGFVTEKTLRTPNFSGKWETGRHYTYNINIREDSVNYKDIDFDYEF